MKTICIIPARGGSKGIKKKNLQLLGGRPLIYYPINSAIKSGVCDVVLVSTDDNDIAQVAKKYGATVPFLRPKKYSKDFTTTEETLKQALLSYESYVGHKFDICVFLTCTNIFRKLSWIVEAVETLKTKKNIDSAFSVHKLYKHFWHYEKNNKLTKVLPWMAEYTSRQVAPKLFREDTGLACASRSKFWRAGKRIGPNVHIIPNEDSLSGIDIHSLDDLVLANAVFKNLKKNKRLSEYSL